MYFEAESEGIKYQVSVSESRSHWQVGIREDASEWEYHKIPKEDYAFMDNTVSFLFGNSSYLIDVLNKGTEYTVYTRGVFKTFKVYNEEALLHESLKAGGGLASGASLKSGMPGKITKIFVKPGDQLKEGDPILIMEAMKMENEMRASGEVTVREILVAEGDTVESGAELVTYVVPPK